MTSLQLAILLAIILAITFAAATYIYTTVSSAPQWAQPVVVKSACAYSDGTVAVYVSMVGSGCVRIMRVEVCGMSAPADVTMCAGQQGYIRVSLPSVVQTLAEGRIVMEDGRAVPFMASTC